MAEAFLNQKKSSGVKLNDIIEDFKYVYKGQTIKAGDFVNYINGVASKTSYGTSANIQLSTQAYSGYKISAVQLDDSRILIIHSYSSSYYLYGVVCTISNTTITMGTDIQLSSTTNSCSLRSPAVLLPSGKVFVAYRDSTPCPNGMLLTVSGTTITVSANLKLSTIVSNADISIDVLPDGNVFVSHSYNSSNYLYGMVVTISGTTLTAGTDTSIFVDRNAGFSISSFVLPNNDIFIAHSGASNMYLYSNLVRISGTTVTVPANVTLNNTVAYAGYQISANLLTDGKVFIAHSGYSDYCLYGKICSVTDTTIKSESLDIALGTVKSYTANIVTSVALSNNRVFVVHNYDNTNYYLYGIVATVEGTNIISSTRTSLNSTKGTGRIIAPLLLNNGTILLVHSRDTSNFYLDAQVFGINDSNVPSSDVLSIVYEDQVTLSSEPSFDAIALSGGVGGTDSAHKDQIKIARPNVEVI